MILNFLENKINVSNTQTKCSISGYIVSTLSTSGKTTSSMPRSRRTAMVDPVDARGRLGIAVQTTAAAVYNSKNRNYSDSNAC